MRRRTSQASPALLALILYVAGALALFHPLWRDGGALAYGQFGDLTATIAYWREIVEHDQNPFTEGRLPDFNAPNGMPVLWKYAAVAPVSSGILWGLTFALGAVEAQSAYLLGGLVLNSFTAYLLVRWLTSGWIPAFTAGCILGWFPWVIAAGSWQPDFVHAWPFVLQLWALLALQRSRSPGSILVAAIATAFAMAWTPYYVLFALVLVLGFIVADAIAGEATWRRRLASWSVLLGCSALVVSLMAFIDRSGGGPTAARSYPLSELYLYTTKPSAWFQARQGVFAELGDSVDRGLWANSSYIGISVVSLASVPIVQLFRRRMDDALYRAGVVAACVTLAAALIAAPPSVSVFGAVLPMPSRAIYELAPTWRVLGRLVLVVEVGLAVLVGISLHQLLHRRRMAVQLALGALVLAIVVADLWPRPRTYVRLEPPPTVARIRDLPPGVVANYPLQPEGQTNMDVRFFQQAMRHPVLNGYPSGSEDEAAALALADLTAPGTLDALRDRGVRYLLVSQPAAAPMPPDGVQHLLTDERYALYRLEVG